jgi:hypothetical protein
MIKTIVLTGLMSAVLAASSSAFAAGQKYAPGQEVKTGGSHGSPGASYYAPGHEMQRRAPCSHNGPGASGCAPGRR